MRKKPVEVEMEINPNKIQSPAELNLITSK